MKKQINPTIKAHLIRSAFYVLLLVAVCVIPFALAQRNTSNKNTASKNAAGKTVIKGAANRVAPATTTLRSNDPRVKGKFKAASSTRFSNAHGTVPRPAAKVAAPAGVACWYDLTPGAAPFVPGVDDIGNHTDDGDTFISLPFTVNLYGGSFTSALVGSNGQVSFGTDYTSFQITCPPPFGGTGSTDVLAPYWGDQCTNTAGCGGGESCASCGIFTTTTGSSPNRVFYIEWRTQYYNQSTPLLDYEVALYENGTPPFSIIYSNISAAGAANDSQLVVGNKFNETCFTVFGCDTTGGTSPPVSSGQAFDAIAAATPTPTAPPACSPWAMANPYPTTIVRYGFVQTATDFYVFGGVDNGSTTNAVNSYNVASGTWTPRAPMPFSGEAPTCALDSSTNIVYCADGFATNSFASYDIAADSWTNLAPDPFTTDHYGSASGAFNGKVFVAGGFTPGAAVDVYDIASNSWSSGTASPISFFLAGYQQVGQFLYVVGGFTPSAPSNSTSSLRLDLSSGTWDTGPTFTEARADFSLAYDASTNKLYAIGGDADGGGFFDSTNLVDELDVSGWPGGTWTSSTPNLPTPNRQANQAGFYGGGNIWSVGGLDGATFTFLPDVLFRPSCAGGGGPCTLQPWQIVAPYAILSESVSVSTDGTFAYGAGGFDGSIGAPTNSFNQYDPVADTWTPLPNVPGAFYDGPSVYAANTNRVYVFGGIDATFTPSNVVQVYDVGSNTWVANGAPMPGPRYFASAAYYDANGKIYVISGFDENFLETSTTWEYDPVADTWDTSRTDMPVPTGGAGYSIIGQNIYLAGTWNGGNGSTQHYTYDIVADTWTAVAPVPVNIYRPASGSIGTNEYLAGGGNPFLGSKVFKGPKARKGAPHPSTRSPAVSYNSTYIYDSLGDSWSTGPNLNVAHSFTGGTAVGNDLLVVTGFDGVTGDTTTVEKSHCGPGGGTPTPTPTGTPTPTPGGTCPPVITESANQEIVSGNSVACNNGFGTTENHYWRAFNMNTFTGGADYIVTSIDFGIELAQSGGGTGQPLTVNLYANHGSPFPAGDWQSNMIASSGQLNIPDQSLTVFNVPLSVTAPGSALELVMEVTTPDGTAVGNLFFVGSNPDGQTADSYLSAADCGVNDPTPTQDLGFPDMMIVFNVNGSCGGTPTPTPTPTPVVTPTPTPVVTPTPTPGTPTPTPGTPTPTPPERSPSPRPRPTPFPRPTPP